VGSRRPPRRSAADPRTKNVRLEPPSGISTAGVPLMSKQPNHGPGRRPRERRAQKRVSSDLTLSANDRNIAGFDLPVDNVLIDWAMVILVRPIIWGVVYTLPFPGLLRLLHGRSRATKRSRRWPRSGHSAGPLFLLPRNVHPSHLCFALLSPLFSQGTGRARGVEGSPVAAMAPRIMGMFRASWDSRLVEAPGPVAMVFLLPPSRSISRASPPSLGAPQRAPFPPASPTWMRRQSACPRGAFNSYPASPVVVPLTSLPVLFSHPSAHQACAPRSATAAASATNDRAPKGVKGAGVSGTGAKGKSPRARIAAVTSLCRHDPRPCPQSLQH